MITYPWDGEDFEVVRSHTRSDGCVAALERRGTMWRAVVRNADGKHVETPQPGHAGQAPLSIFLRRCVDPLPLPLYAAEALAVALAGVRLRKTELMMFDHALADGRASALVHGLRGIETRKGGEAIVAVRKRIEAVREAAIAELPAGLRAEVTP